MLIEPKKGIAGLKPVIHGGIDEMELRKYGLLPQGVIDFSVCCNPYPHPQSFFTVLTDVDIRPYPDSEAAELRTVIAAHLNIEENNVLPGSGTTELIRLIIQSYLNNNDGVLIPVPAYGEYEIASRIAGGIVYHFDWQFPSDVHSRIEYLLYKIKKIRPKIIFLCNPNNPTGHYLSRTDIESIAEAIPGTLIVIDEAYVNFVDNRWSSQYLIERGNVIILRSMTKDYGIAGLRLGYALADREVIKILRKVCPPWNVNVFAQKAGCMLLSDNEYLSASLPKGAKY